MVKEIRFLPTGEVRKPRTGDWFLGEKNRPVCAAQDFITSKYPILRMMVVEDEDSDCRVNTMGLGR
jgi:hypothetical protein